MRHRSRVTNFSISRAIAFASYMPIQIGRTVSHIARRIHDQARIHFSTSMVDSLRSAPLTDGLADKAVGETVGEPHWNITAGSGAVGVRVVKFSVLFSQEPANHLRLLAVVPFNDHFQNLPYVTEVIGSFDLTRAVEKPRLYSCSGMPSASKMAGVLGRGKNLNASTASNPTSAARLNA